MLVALQSTCSFIVRSPMTEEIWIHIWLSLAKYLHEKYFSRLDFSLSVLLRKINNYKQHLKKKLIYRTWSSFFRRIFIWFMKNPMPFIYNFKEILCDCSWCFGDIFQSQKSVHHHTNSSWLIITRKRAAVWSHPQQLPCRSRKSFCGFIGFLSLG